MSGPDEVKPVRLAIVSPVHNRRELTLQCLRSLERIDRTGINLSIYIVNDGCTDGTPDAIREQFPGVNIIDGNGELWYTAGTNLGVKAALKEKPDYVLCINDDSIFDEKSVRHLVDCVENHKRSVVGALLLLWDTPHRVFQVAPVWNTWKGGWQHWYQQTVWTVPQNPWSVEAIVGNCVLFPAVAFEECGFMNPRVSAQYGDAEFTTRLRKTGWQLLIEPRARVFCQPNYEHISLSSRPIRQQFDLLFRNSASGMNILHQFRQLLHSAPNKFSGLAAFFAFYARVALRKLGRSGSQPGSEGKLSDHFAANVVKR